MSCATTTRYLDWREQSMLSMNENSIGDSKGMAEVEDIIKSKPSLKDVEEGSSTHDLATMGLDLQARIRRLEKLFAEQKEK
ncbi:hypothetical protein PTKIN_Ptkin11bG0175000 [Pterospermum kingtungense]